MADRLFRANCRCCSSSMRATIDELIVRNAPSASIAEKITLACPNEPAISVSSVARHRKRHLASEWLSRARAKELTGLDEIDIDALREREQSNVYRLLILYRNQADELIERAVKAGDLSVASSLIGRRTKLLEGMARVLDLMGPVGNVTTNNFLISPDYIELRSSIIRALSRPEFKAARDAVIAAMLQIETKPAASEVIDADFKIADGGKTVAEEAATGAAAPPSAPFIEAGVGQADNTPSPSSETSCHVDATDSAPAVTRLESFIDQRTGDRSVSITLER